MFNDKFKFDQLLEKNFYFEILINYAKASIYQYFWKLEQLQESLEILEKSYLKLINFYYKILKINENKSKSFYLNNSSFYQLITVILLYSENMLQQTAVYSQIGKHELALKKSHMCLNQLKCIIYHVYRLLKSIYVIGVENIQKLPSIQSSIVSLKIYSKYINEFIENYDLDCLNTCNNWKTKNENTNKHILQNIENKLRENNNYNNFEKINLPWIENFHISNVVKLQSLKYVKDKLSIVSFNEDVIINIFLLLSCCIFSLGAENRFLARQNIFDDVKEKEKNINTKKNIINETEIEIKLQRNNTFIKSEQYHYKTLELTIFGFNPNCKLINHFINSYIKNYSFSIPVIEEVDETSVISLKNSEYFDPKTNIKQSRFEDDEFMLEQSIKIKNDKNNMNKLNEEILLKEEFNFKKEKIGNKNMFECNDIVVFPKNDKNLFTKKLNEDTILKNPQSEKTFDVEIPSPIRVNPNSIKQLINKNSNSHSDNLNLLILNNSVSNNSPTLRRNGEKSKYNMITKTQNMYDKIKKNYMSNNFKEDHSFKYSINQIKKKSLNYTKDMFKTNKINESSKKTKNYNLEKNNTPVSRSPNIEFNKATSMSSKFAELIGNIESNHNTVTNYKKSRFTKTYSTSTDIKKNIYKTTEESFT